MADAVIKETSIKEIYEINLDIPEFKQHYTEKQFKERIRGKENLILAAYFENKPAGYLIGYDRFKDGSFYLWMGAVKPKFRKKGLLTSLMKYAEKWAKEGGYNKLKIKTRNDRREMLSYLVKHNFMFTEVNPKPKIEDNRIILEKRI